MSRIDYLRREIAIARQNASAADTMGRYAEAAWWEDRAEELTKEISASEKYQKFAAAQQAMNALMAEVNAEIKFCITGERPSTCTHDCSSCAGCH